MANICFNWYINQIPRNLSKSKVNKCKESHTLYANWWKTELKAIGYINPDGQQKNDGCLLIKINKGQKIMKSHGTRKKKICQPQILYPEKLFFKHEGKI